jgi:hypothetical protein
MGYTTASGSGTGNGTGTGTVTETAVTETEDGDVVNADGTCEFNRETYESEDGIWTIMLQINRDCSHVNRTVDFDGLTIVTVTKADGTFTVTTSGEGGHIPHDCDES